MSADYSDEDSIAISCGNLAARLILSRFLCPGIHQECVLYDGQIVTPKMFSVMGDKEKLKDWKNAIRVNGRSIRKVMDQGLLDFANHDQHCTGRCASRNTGISKYDVTQFGNNIGLDSFLTTATGVPLVAEMSNLGKEPAYSILREVTGTNDEEEAKIEVMLSQMHAQPTTNGALVLPSPATKKRKMKTDQLIREKLARRAVKPVVFPVSAPIAAVRAADLVPRQIIDVGPQGLVMKKVTSSEVAIKQEKEDEYSNGSNVVATDELLGTVRYQPISSSFQESPDVRYEPISSSLAEPPDASSYEAGSTSSKEKTLEEDVENSQTFWKGILKVGFFDEIFQEIQSALATLKTDLVKTHVGNANDAKRMTRIVQELNLMNKIKHKMAQQKNETEREKQSLLAELEALKRKVKQSEDMQRELKRKSECYDQLMELSRNKRVTITPAASSPKKAMVITPAGPEATKNTVIRTTTDSGNIKKPGPLCSKVDSANTSKPDPVCSKEDSANTTKPGPLCSKVDKPKVSISMKTLERTSGEEDNSKEEQEMSDTPSVTLNMQTFEESAEKSPTVNTRPKRKAQILKIKLKDIKPNGKGGDQAEDSDETSSLSTHSRSSRSKSAESSESLEIDTNENTEEDMDESSQDKS